MKGVSAFKKHEGGGVAVLFGVVMLFLFVGGGVAATYVIGSSEKAKLQSSLDAAVLAAAGLDAEASPNERMQLAKNVFAAGMATYAHSTDAASEFSVSGFVVRGNVRAHVAAVFGKLMGTETVLVSTESAATKMASAPICVLTLNRTNPNTFQIYGSPARGLLFTAKNCAVQANSRNRQGMKAWGRAEGRAAQFGVSGGYSGEGFTPTPIAGTENVADPLASVPPPTPGACVDVSKKLIQQVVTLSPGTYCGGLDLKAQSEVTLLPGVYIMKDGQFRVDSNTRVTGQEVLIAFNGANSYMYLSSGAVVNLTSPKSGTYMNMQFMSDRDLSRSKFQQEWTTIMGNATLDYDGVMYLPEQQIWVGGGSVVNGKSPGMIIVGDQFWLQDSSNVTVSRENSRNLPVAAAPTFHYSAVLIR